MKFWICFFFLACSSTPSAKLSSLPFVNLSHLLFQWQPRAAWSEPETQNFSALHKCLTSIHQSLIIRLSLEQQVLILDNPSQLPACLKSLQVKVPWAILFRTTTGCFYASLENQIGSFLNTTFLVHAPLLASLDAMPNLWLSWQLFPYINLQKQEIIGSLIEENICKQIMPAHFFEKTIPFLEWPQKDLQK